MSGAVAKAVAWYQDCFRESGQPAPDLGRLLRGRGYYLLDGSRVRYDPLGYLWPQAALAANEWGYGGASISAKDRLGAARFFAKEAGVSWWRVWRFGQLWDAGKIEAMDLYREVEIETDWADWAEAL